MIADSSTGLAEKLLDWRAIFILAYFGLLFVASYLGFVPPDGAEYLRMAKSIVVGHGCSLSGNYSAIWPCGYPMSIALLGFGRDFISLIFVSKITNFLLVVTGMLMLSSVIRDYRIILLATLNPVIWGIAPWTISENLFCFAVFGITATTQKLHDIMISGTLQYVKIAFWSAAVCLFIVIGYFARYFFAPFAVALYAATLFAYGRRTALAALPAYIVAAGLFLVLIHYNSEETGFGTGMTRLPAQESMRFLLIYFSLQCVRVVSRFVPVFIILWPEYIFSFKRTLGTDKKTDAASPPLLSGFLIFSSIGYMALQFLIRCFFSYDLFTFRLIGPGLVLLISGLALAVMRGRSAQRESAWFGPSLKTLTLAVYCFVVSLYSLELGGILSDWRLGRATSARALILNSKAPATNAKVVFSFVRPTLSRVLVSLDEFYYGSDKKIVYPALAPTAWPDNAATYRAKLQEYVKSDCVLDFTQLKSYDDLKKELSGTDYDVDVYLTGLKVIRVKGSSIDRSLNEFLARAFRPGQYVPCQQALEINQSP